MAGSSMVSLDGRALLPWIVALALLLSSLSVRAEGSFGQRLRTAVGSKALAARRWLQRGVRRVKLRWGRMLKPRVRGYKLLYGRPEVQREKMKLMVADAPEKVGRILRFASKHTEVAAVTDLHWGYGQDQHGVYHPQEDFRKDDIFVRFIKRFNTKHLQRRRLLSIGGDWLELMEAVSAEASRAEVKRAISRIVRAHPLAANAIFEAVVNKGMRVTYLRGNHDVFLMDPDMRLHLKTELAEQGFRALVAKGLATAHEHDRIIRRFDRRFAYTGFGTPIGRKGEALHVHGDGYDPFNSWQSWVLPLSPDGRIRTTFGWEVVTHVFNPLEREFPEIDNGVEGSDLPVLKKALSTMVGLRRMTRVLGNVLKRNNDGQFSVAARERIKAVNVEAWRHWASVVKLDQAYDRARRERGEKPQGLAHWAHTLERINNAHRPFHAHMKSRWILGNTLRVLGKALSQIRADKASGLSRFLDALERGTETGLVIAGHDHQEQQFVRRLAGDKLVGFIDAGTWTKERGEWRLSVAGFSLDRQGKLAAKAMGRATEKGQVLALGPAADNHTLDLPKRWLEGLDERSGYRVAGKPVRRPMASGSSAGAPLQDRLRIGELEGAWRGAAAISAAW